MQTKRDPNYCAVLFKYRKNTFRQNCIYAVIFILNEKFTRYIEIFDIFL